MTTSVGSMTLSTSRVARDAGVPETFVRYHGDAGRVPFVLDSNARRLFDNRAAPILRELRKARAGQTGA